MRFFGILKMWRGWQKAFVQIAQRCIWSGWKPRKYWGSLTVCEGVSLTWLSCLKEMSFPHCMWGCIVNDGMIKIAVDVPSLYVRVYLWLHSCRGWAGCSLTVCEGVSENHHPRSSSFQFPHCMWGCIETETIKTTAKLVPSLYVRVYRFYWRCGETMTGSLIVYDGVSAINQEKKLRSLFPHYMWGCTLLIIIFSV